MSEQNQKIINDFRSKLEAAGLLFKEHNHGVHFRVQKEGLWYNVYPTKGSVRNNENTKDIPGGIGALFGEQGPEYHEQMNLY